MIKRLLVIVTLGVMLSGCFMVPMALIGPATGGFNTASILKSGLSTGTNYLVKKSTGKTIGEHVFDGINKEITQQSFAPKKIKPLIVDSQ
tara:strand:+ start:341 stop:610 length:270 start_codon:yes stop_codon:yes gene_type:complete